MSVVRSEEEHMGKKMECVEAAKSLEKQGKRALRSEDFSAARLFLAAAAQCYLDANEKVRFVETRALSEVADRVWHKRNL